MASMPPPTLRLFSFLFFLPFHSLVGDIATEFLYPTLQLLSFLFFLTFHSLAGGITTEFLYPNYYASYFNFTNNSNVFCSTSTFSVAFNNPSSLDSQYYLNATNASLWSSFDYPTDTLFPNHVLPVSFLLTSTADENDPTLADYCLLISTDDAKL
ncbi:hypothetical protein ZIOFF_069423 [Zingiber officinale]|uniref:Uncharacterized protein n=1 Tax=Zingiber officinale TaxID=94328 RepID=A0A8J5ERP7_ZINOF|nr:hypothetical protein ZIOFF_069423 [Zingiber officinale]